MKENILERNARLHVDEKIAAFRVKQQQPYEFKVAYAQARAWEFYNECGRREKALMRNGCNYFGETTIRSAPFAIFNRQDLLQLALDLHVPVPEIYGEIRRDDTGTLRTTRAQRTGCSMCGFGIQLEKRPHRFDRLYERNPKEWEFWMIEMGWGAVLDYIGVGWRPEHQITMEELLG